MCEVGREAWGFYAGSIRANTVQYRTCVYGDEAEAEGARDIHCPTAIVIEASECST
jgi:hypothetical protein